MRSYRITNIGTFMTRFLTTDCFDSFLLEAADIRMAAAFTIDGHRDPGFYSAEEMESSKDAAYDCIPWASIRGTCREIIKGSKAPTAFRFTLRLKPEYVSGTLHSMEDTAAIDAVASLAINIRLAGNGLRVITGVAMREFTMDHSADRIWDMTMERFLYSKGITFEEDV